MYGSYMQYALLTILFRSLDQHLNYVTDYYLKSTMLKQISKPSLHKFEIFVYTTLK